MTSSQLPLTREALSSSSAMTTNSARPPASKRSAKMSQNHSLNVNDLLNFTLPPRQPRPPTNLPRRSRKTGTHQGVWNKERFVNAQYRFVMHPGGDYTVHFADPDIFFQWQDILQVIIPRSSTLASTSSNGSEAEGNTTCPICLSSPVAPRMTKCGHIFCFPCILHYLGNSDNKWARCPICFDSVNERQLKTVRWYDGPVPLDGDSAIHPSSSTSTIDHAAHTDLHPGSTLRMRLMQRPQITTLALPRSHYWPSDLLPPHKAPFHFLPDVFLFAKFMLATPEYLITELSKNLDELGTERRVLSEMNDDLGISFVDGAEQKVRNQIAKAAALESPLLKEQVEKALRDQQDIGERFGSHIQKSTLAGVQQREDIPEEFLALKSSGTSTPASNEKAVKPVPAQGKNPPRQRRNVNPPPPSTSTYYFYQAASGQSLFLHPLDIRILLSHFRSYSSFPNEITIRVEAYSEGTVNDDLRKRCKYLAHMPEGADVVFVEADLAGVVGAEGLKNFDGALKMRTSRRKEKGRKEDRARAKAEEVEKEKQVASWIERAPRSAVAEAPSGYVIRESTPSPTQETEEADRPAPPPVQGAWGTRSFASTLHSSPPSNNTNHPAPRREVNEWDLDDLWQQLERNAGRRNKRSNKVVILGGGGAGRRR